MKLLQHQILLNQNPSDGGGVSPGTAETGAQPAAGSGETPPASEPSTATKLWGSAPEKEVATTPTVAAGAPATEAQVAATGAPASQKIELTEELLSRMGENIAKAIQPQPAAEKPPTMSQEEFDQMFNIYRPNKEVWAAIRGEDEGAALQALTTMLHGSAKQATTIASHLIQNELAQLKQILQPALAMAEERTQTTLKEEFFKAHPDLKGLEPILVLIRDKMIASGRRFKTKEEAFKAVAEEAKAQVAAIPGLRQNGAAAGGAPAGQPAGQTARMPSLSGGKGQAGAGDASGSTGGAKTSTAKKIFG